MTTNERLRVIQRVYAEWAAEQRTAPDLAYAHDGPSQYTEGIDALGAPASAQDDLHQRVGAALRDAGLPIEPF
ncbi:hypothetical protein [Cellulomonas fengjieae]|uniref:Uncharacterized protein n=1 Tax=Cellulomonas fengjieae TaxID=2819978 RepID=A0ABS3SLU0_9CELL|nr:hypothetical protein [Cellulomonas fengjieae]MBO3086627.1 hypothetical protein [Cellulomonas fengjieae]QVI66524.1 hypothetical protein KG102_02640 [Cellulomonas fengjieae]